MEARKYDRNEKTLREYYKTQDCWHFRRIQWEDYKSKIRIPIVFSSTSFRQQDKFPLYVGKLDVYVDTEEMAQGRPSSHTERKKKGERTEGRMKEVQAADEREANGQLAYEMYKLRNWDSKPIEAGDENERESGTNSQLRVMGTIACYQLRQHAFPGNRLNLLNEDCAFIPSQWSLNLP
ncbi:hypothetical protein BDZ45DRAFT_736082 [Acephala macrosclerotiorum]|nr:hypothetical protein BDZ45DRAFT_736082 [Acephala macrosclerotiorum]